MTLRLYVVHAKVNVNVCDYDKRTPLHVCVAEGRKECFVILMESGANCHAMDRWGSTPIVRIFSLFWTIVFLLLTDL